MSVRTEEEIEKEHDSDVVEEDEENEDRSMNKLGINNGGIAGRTVTLQMLLAANMLQPGKSTMTIEYLGQKFIGDLLPDGKIKSQETETIFCSPSAWAMYCKRIINPDKKSGCGWASVKYKGKKLDAYKATWLRKCQLQKDSTLSDGEIESEIDKKEMTPPPPIKRIVVPHNTINNRNIPHDANTLVEAVPFSSLGKIQPFLVSMTKSTLFLMDFHCHLTRNEVCGYLGGSWDVNGHNLIITHAFPCRNTKKDRQKANEVEMNIQRAMLKKNLTLLGWYHSHPKSPSQPTFRDCDTQLEYQIKMKGPSDASYSPCVGIICSPYNDENMNMVSTFLAYWVLPPPEHRPMEYGRPMVMSYTVTQDTNVSEFIRNEMEQIVMYYKQFDKELINFDDIYRDEFTFMEKLKNSLYLKFPKEESDELFWNWMRELLGLEREEIFERPISAPEEKPIDVDQKSEDGDDKKFQTQTQLQQTQNSIISLQQQLSLPSGLNMNPSILGSSLVIPTVGGSTHSTTSSSPRDSPITISSNAPSPGKFEIPIRASPSPAKSDTSSTKTRNSPAPSPSKFNVSDVPRNSPNVTPSLPQYDLGTASGLASDSMNEFLTASLASLVGKLPPGMQPSELAILFQQKLAEYGVTGFNPMAAAAAITPKPATVSSSSSSSKSYKDIYRDLDKYDMNYLLQSQYNMVLPPQKTSSKSSKSSKRNYDSGMASTSVSSLASNKSQSYMELDMDQKAELSKLSDFMKSPEYASLLMQQATGYGSGAYGLGSEISVSKKSSKKSHFTSSDLNNFLQASSKIPDLSSLLHGGKMSDYGSPMSNKKSIDYAALLEHHKLPDLTSITPISSGNSVDGSSSGAIPGVPDLSALFAPVLGGKKLEAGSSAANSGGANDMLSSLLQAGKSSELNSLLFAQGKSSDLSSYFAAPSPSSSTSSKSGVDHGSVYPNISPVKTHDIASLFQHTKYPGIPDPLAKSTLAANNMYMGPSSSLLKLQQEAINAMMMKPPKATTPLSSLSSSSGSSATVARSTETPPSSSFERHSTPPNKPSNRDSPHITTNPNLKYNFSAADLAVSSISDYNRKASATSPVDMSNLTGHSDPPQKKRAEFSSIADLAAPPLKISKIDEIDIRGDNSPGVLNLSGSD